MDDPATSVIANWQRLEGERGTWKSHWQQVADYMLPDRGDYVNARSPGQKRMQLIVDSTAPWALQQFSAGMHSLLTSSTLKWFALLPDDDRLLDLPGVQQWLDDVGDRMYSVFNSPRHNFASQSHELYADLGSIGTAVMAVLESPKSGILFSGKHLKECVIAENEEDRVDTLIRKWEWTAKQAVQQWGKAAGEGVLRAFAVKPESKFSFLHSVQPRIDRKTGRSDATNMPFESRYVSMADGATIAEGGFDEFPYLVPRFSKAVGEIYGRGPGMMVLPDVKMLNKMTELVLKSGQIAVQPTLLVPDDGYFLKVRSVPGGIIPYRAGSKDEIKPLQTGGQVQLGMELLNSLKQQILRGFYVDWLLLATDPMNPASAGKGITATYTLHDRDQKMQLLSPLLARLQSEFLGPLIDRVFAIMMRQSMRFRFGPGSPLPPPPPGLSGQQIKVEYISPIAVAQRSSELDAVGRLIQTAMMLGQVDPTAPRTLDIDFILRRTGRDLNTPARALRSAEDVQAERAALAEQQAQAAQVQSLAGVAGAARDGGAAAHSLAQAFQPQQQAS